MNCSRAGSRVLAFVVKEFREALPPITFFLIGFNLVELTTQLVLADYLARLTNFMVATTMALVVGKVVLVANALPFFQRFDTAPLIRSILFKTVVYWVVVLLARFLEQIVEHWIGGGTMGELPEVRGSALLLAPVRCDLDLDLRSFPSLHLYHRAESAAR